MILALTMTAVLAGCSNEDKGKETAFTMIFTGAAHAAVIKADDSPWTWGGNEYGQLGNGTTENRTAPCWTSRFWRQI